MSFTQEMVDLRMRPTPIPSPPTGPRPDPLAAALAEAPNLRVLRARQPTLLNSFLIDAAKNIKLERIELVDGAATTSLAEQEACFPPHPYLLVTGLDRRHRHLGNCVSRHASSSSPRRPQHSVPPSKRTVSDIGIGMDILEAAKAELEAQIESEPKTLFAAQIVAHPRLNALVRAGRLHFIMERLLMEKRGLERCQATYGSGNESGCRCCYGPRKERCLCVGPADRHGVKIWPWLR